MMNDSFEVDYQMRRLSIASRNITPPSPASLSSSMTSFFSSTDSQEFEHDCSRFDAMMPAPSSNSLSSSHYATDQRMGLSRGFSRSRCVSNLSSLGDSLSSASDSSVDSYSLSSASDSSVGSSRQIPSYEAGPNAGWVCFVDAPSR